MTHARYLSIEPDIVHIGHGCSIDRISRGTRDAIRERYEAGPVLEFRIPYGAPIGLSMHDKGLRIGAATIVVCAWCTTAQTDEARGLSRVGALLEVVE